jgi:Tol biopolymer transport system component
VYYELVTGRKPFRADTPMAVAIKQATEPIPLPRQIAPDLPQNVEMVLLKALAKDPNDRYQSMAEFTNELEELAHVVGKDSRPQVLKDARKEKPPKVKAAKEKKVRVPGRKRTGLWIGLGIGFAILAALGAFLLLGGLEYITPAWNTLPFARFSGQVMSICLQDGENQLCFTDPLTRSITCKGSPFGGVLAGISISPDGQKVAVADGHSLSIRNLNNVVQTSFNISSLDNYYFSEWSPGMSKLLFVSYESDGSSEVYSVKVDGSASTQLTNTSGVAHSWEQWSPDGRILATCAQGGVSYICTFDANGNNYQRISSALTNDASITTTADWSPDSQRIVFTSSFNNTWDLNLMDADGRNIKTLLRDQPWEIHYPHYSADGTKIIFTAMDYSGSNAYVWIGMIDADGTDLTNLTNKASSCTSGQRVP